MRYQFTARIDDSGIILSVAGISATAAHRLIKQDYREALGLRGNSVFGESTIGPVKIEHIESDHLRIWLIGPWVKLVSQLAQNASRMIGPVPGLDRYATVGNAIIDFALQPELAELSDGELTAKIAWNLRSQRKAIRRDSARYGSSFNDLLNTVESPGASPEEACDRREFREHALQALEGMKEFERAAVVLRSYGLSIRMIADLTKRSVWQVYRTLRKVRTEHNQT